MPEGEGWAPLAQVVPRPKKPVGRKGSSRVETHLLRFLECVWELGLSILGRRTHAGWGDRRQGVRRGHRRSRAHVISTS